MQLAFFIAKVVESRSHWKEFDPECRLDQVLKSSSHNLISFYVEAELISNFEKSLLGGFVAGSDWGYCGDRSTSPVQFQQPAVQSEIFEMNLGEKSTLRWSWCGNLRRSWRSPRQCWPTLTSGLDNINMIQVHKERQQIESTPMLPRPGGPGGGHHRSFLSRPAHGGRRLQGPTVLARHLQGPRRLHWQAHSQGTQSECQLQEIIYIFACRCNQQATQGGLPPSGGSPPSSSSQSSASSRWASQRIWELGLFWNAYYYYVKYCPF